MNQFFSIGELSKLQNISRQTLIYYDKIGLFCPSYVDPDNGYRYYSWSQLDSLDTILIMKKIGFSLDEIKEHMKHYTLDSSICALQKQLTIINRQISELQIIKNRIEHRCRQMELSRSLREASDSVTEEIFHSQYILLQKVEAPGSLDQTSLATKQCFVRAFREKLPIFFQSGAIVPYLHIIEGNYTEASFAFVPIEKKGTIRQVKKLPEGHCVSTYHVGDYQSIGSSYERILAYCQKQRLHIISDSYEFAINDYLSTGDEAEYVTKIIFYVEPEAITRQTSYPWKNTQNR